jgi:integrase/recombinase XerD
MDKSPVFPLHHRGMNCYGIRVPKEDPRNTLIRQIPHMKWSVTNRCWYVPDTPGSREALNEIFFRELPLHPVEPAPGSMVPFPAESDTGTDSADYFPGPEVQQAVERFRQYMEVNRYAENSIKNYTNALLGFLKYFQASNWRQLTNEDIERFQMDMIIAKNLSVSYQNTFVSAIKVFYEVVTGLKVAPEFIGRPRKGNPLPRVLSLEQIRGLLLSVQNQKHRMMLSLIYACGLRSGELINLKPGDILSDRMMIHLKGAKGNKDRLVPLSEKLLHQLREYFKVYKPKMWLFEGQHQGEKYTQRSLQQVFKRALVSARLDKTMRLHDLRHSYATHQVEAGTNQRVIQELLGHKSSKTTEIYTHVSSTFLNKVYNPFDDLGI